MKTRAAACIREGILAARLDWSALAPAGTSVPRRRRAALAYWEVFSMLAARERARLVAQREQAALDHLRHIDHPDIIREDPLP